MTAVIYRNSRMNVPFIENTNPKVLTTSNGDYSKIVGLKKN
jgi:hypothetical protein